MEHVHLNLSFVFFLHKFAQKSNLLWCESIFQSDFRMNGKEPNDEIYKIVFLDI